jgi:uncharacterized membrane protein
VLISLLVLLIIAGLVYWAGHKLIGAFGLPAPIGTILDVLLVVFVVLYILAVFGLVDIPRRL